MESGITQGMLSPGAAAMAGTAVAAGFALALAHLAALAANVRVYLAGHRIGRALVLHVVRLAGLGAAFVGAALLGAPALLGMLLGYTLGRVYGLRRHR